MKSRKFKVRFNLGKGKNRYMKWKIECNGTTLVYIDPNDVTLIMENCRLVNQKTAAEKIYKGANKTVCAWVECDNLSIREPINIGGEHVSYNPRVKPHWVFQGENADGQTFAMIITKGRELLT